MVNNTEMKIWHVYLISTHLDTLYAGVTTDVERRYKEHAAGKKKCAKYLRGKGPLTLVWHQAIGKKEMAMAIEYKIKRLNRAKKKALIAGDLSLEEAFSDILNGTVLPT